MDIVGAVGAKCLRQEHKQSDRAGLYKPVREKIKEDRRKLCHINQDIKRKKWEKGKVPTGAEEKVVKEVNWTSYFAHIQGVCPWAYKAYMKDNILVWKHPENCFKTIKSLYITSGYEAFVYVFKDSTPKQLEKLCDALNTEQETDEWLWSHPDVDEGDNNSTPVPALIQQNRARLEKIREQIGYYDE